MLEPAQLSTTQEPEHAAIHREKINSVYRQLPLILTVDAAAGIILILFALLFAENLSPLSIPWIASLLLGCGIIYLLNKDRVGIPTTAETVEQRERYW